MKINVLKPFVFSAPLEKDQRLPTERLFTVGEHEITEEMANHPWIKNTHAEGKIESPEQRVKRVKEQKVKADADAAQAAIATAEAEAAVRRATTAQPVLTASAEELEEELNTPVHVLRERGPGGKKSGGRIDTPVNQL